MSEVLYRKYRPKNFAEVINQETTKTILQNDVRLGRVYHAYLFTGPRGVGKTTLARILGKALNCQNPKDGEPDANCRNCELIHQGRFLDFVEIDAASYTGVENIREVIEHVKFSPSMGRYKVFVIDEVHMLSKAAFNALLKTLEEPPGHAVFILATTEIHKVPATIISRTQRFDFKRVGQKDLLELLDFIVKDVKIGISPEAMKLIAEAADGSFRDALSIFDQILGLGSPLVTLAEVEDILGLVRISTSQKLLEEVLRPDAQAAVRFVKDLAFSGKDLVQFAKSFLEYLRLVLLVKLDLENIRDLGLTAEEATKLQNQAQALSGERLLEIIKKILEAYREIKHSPVPELPLLATILSLTSYPQEALAKHLEVPAAVSPEASSGLDLDTIVDRWADVLGRVKEYNHSLLSSLRLGRIVAVSGNDLTLAFPYNFHKERIAARKNRIVVEQVLQDVFGQKLRVKVYLERELPSANDLIGEAIRVLGQEEKG